MQKLEIDVAAARDPVRRLLSHSSTTLDDLAEEDEIEETGVSGEDGVGGNGPSSSSTPRPTGEDEDGVVGVEEKVVSRDDGADGVGAGRRASTQRPATGGEVDTEASRTPIANGEDDVVGVEERAVRGDDGVNGIGASRTSTPHPTANGEDGIGASKTSTQSPTTNGEDETDDGVGLEEKAASGDDGVNGVGAGTISTQPPTKNGENGIEASRTSAPSLTANGESGADGVVEVVKIVVSGDDGVNGIASTTPRPTANDDNDASSVTGVEGIAVNGENDVNGIGLSRTSTPRLTANGVNGIVLSRTSTPCPAANGDTDAAGVIGPYTETPRLKKSIFALLTPFERDFIDDAIRDNEEKQRERDRLHVSDEKKALQQRGVDFIHRTLDMDKITDYLERQRLMQDQYLYRNAESNRRWKSAHHEPAAEKENQPHRRLRPVEHNHLCPRLLSMDYPAGARIRLRKKLEVERVEMKLLNPRESEWELLSTGRDKLSDHSDERKTRAAGFLPPAPQNKSVESRNPRGVVPPSSAFKKTSADLVAEEMEEIREQLIRGKKNESKRTKRIEWSDSEPSRSAAKSKNLKRSLVHSAKVSGRKKHVETFDAKTDHRAASAPETARPKQEGAIEKDLRLPPSRPARDMPIGHLLPHNVSTEANAERKFISDYIREAKLEARNNPKAKTNPLVIYLAR